MAKRFIERRRYRRSKRALSFNIKGSQFDVITQAKNIGGAGIYCQINKSIAPMSKVKLALLIPRHKGLKITRGRRRKVLVDRIVCKGVVVRAEKASDPALFGANNYNIAVFLPDMKEGERKKLVQYINCSMAKSRLRKKI